MARRDGQILARGERTWLVRWYSGLDGETARRRYSSKTVTGSRRDARRYLNSILLNRDQGVDVTPSRVTLDHYLDHWLKTSASVRVSPRTVNDYRTLLKTYVRPSLGRKRLDRIRLDDVQALVAELHARKLSPRTIRLAITVLGAALKRAVATGKLLSSATAFVELPAPSKREMQVLSETQVQTFLKAARGTRHGLLFEFLLSTGCRPGEAFALRWSDLDLERGVATIQRTLSRAPGERYVFREPKAKGARPVPLPGGLARLLRQHRRSQAEKTLALGRHYVRELDLVFANERGLPLDGQNLAHRQLRPLLKQAELPALRLYDLRHTHATLLLGKDVHPKIVAERLGHASTRMTLDVYSHVLPDMQQEVMAKVEAVFGS